MTMQPLSPVRLALLLPLLAIASCENATGPAPQLESLPRPLTAAEERIVESSNGFAFDLLRQVNAGSPKENLFISPLSVSMALGMTMNGAASDSYAEMREMLGFAGLSQEEINESYRALIDLLLGLDPGVEMQVANSIWYRRGFPFERSFLDVVGAAFRSDVREVDFEDNHTAGRINDWVKAATRGRIPEIVGEVNSQDVMYLINAIYFKGIWVRQFEKERTLPDLFDGLEGARIPVKMMNAEGPFRYAWTPEYEVVDLPYGNGAFTMTILLPSPGRSVDDLVATLDAPRWKVIVGALAEASIDLSMPRFRLEYSAVLNPMLRELGMRRAFEPGAADFSRMSASAGGDLYVSEVLHKSFVEVDEQGTEAAAATKVTIRVTSMPPAIRIDRPFLFIIRERFSGTILFQGKIVAPELA